MAGQVLTQPTSVQTAAAFTATTVTATNDTRATATSIGVLDGRSLTRIGSVGGSDPLDCYKFSVTQVQTVGVKLTGLSADIDVQIVNSSGTVLVRSIRAGTSSEAMSATLNAGTYYIKVYPGVTGASSDYNLIVSARAPENDLRGGATNFGEVREQTITRSGTVGGVDPRDYWKFVPTINGFALTGQITTTIQLSGMTRNLNLYVYDGNGTLIVSSVNSGTQSESLTLTVNQGGLYYVKVAPATISDSSNYQLTIRT